MTRSRAELFVRLLAAVRGKDQVDCVLLGVYWQMAMARRDRLKGG